MLLKLRSKYQIRKSLTLFNSNEKKVFYSKASYVVKIALSDEYGSNEITEIVYDSTIPLKIADLRNSDVPNSKGEILNEEILNEDILAWVEMYDIPDAKEEIFGGTGFYLADGSSVLGFYPLKRLSSQLARIKAAVPLWKAFIEEDFAAIRKLFSPAPPMEFKENNDEILVEQIKLSGYLNEHPLNYGVTFQNFRNDEKAVLQVAARVLVEAVSLGLKDFPLASKIWVEWDDEYEKYLDFHHKSESADGDVYSYAWNVILEDLSRSEKRRNWHYKQCADCGTWEDLSKPNRRNSKWKRCDACIKERKKLRERDRRANKPDKRPRGRPAKKKSPS
jgi:hypothetical protein